MKLLFFARHWSYLRNFESAIEELAARGHAVHMAVDVEESLGGRQMIERLVARYPDRLSMSNAPGRAVGAWSEVASRIRHGLDYLRFLEPRYAATPHLAARARERAPRALLSLLERSRYRTERGRASLSATLRRFERALPGGRDLEQFIAAQSPDAVLITPLVDIGSRQLDHLRAARALGVRTVLPVGSWDHLSSKALLRIMPDAVLVWNEVQKSEAVEMHGVPADRVVVTGAQCYDQWWTRTPSRSREAFAARVGLRADRPFVLYVCSSLFRGTADEPSFVLDWIEAVRSSSDPRLKDIGILIRPHPSRLDEWSDVDLTDYRNVTFWGAHPVDAESKDDYFESMHYSAAVVGLNTSAFIEASVVGAPVHTVLLPEISVANQEGTIHFHYLLTVNGGLLHAARSLDEHVAALAESVTETARPDVKARRFAEGFVRPFGAGVPATPRFADALEAVAAVPAPAPERTTVADRWRRLLLSPLALVAWAQIRIQLWRKQTWNRLRKEYKTKRRRILSDLKGFLVTKLKRAPRVVSAPPPGALTPKPGRHRDPAKRNWGWSDVPEAHEVRELVSGVLAKSDRPIVVGPWLSETGFELLYWIPFLAWAKTHGNLDPERMVVVSRGGASPWYADITSHYEDAFSLFSPDEFRRRNDERVAAQRGRLKHLSVSPFDRELIAQVTHKRGLSGAHLLHPSDMYRLFENFWFQRTPVTLIESFTRFATIPPAGPFAQRSQLPDRYVAAKFYGNTALPDTEENRAFIRGFLAELTQHTDVVLLNTSDRYDDHDDFAPEMRGRIHRIEHLMRPEDNLAVQTEVIRNATAFVGTYGGFSYLAPLLGIDTLAFYSHPTGFRFDHLEVAKRVFAGLRCGAFVELETRALDVVRLGFGGAVRDLVERRVIDLLLVLQNMMAKRGRRLASRSRHAAQVGSEGVNDAMTATRRAGEGLRDRGTNVIKALVRAVRRPIRQRRRRRNRLEEQREFDQVTWGIERELEEIGRRGRLVVVGPWFSEVGFETLYWIPFLHWVKAALRLDSSRVVAVSRGGVSAWYAGLADRYLEIWDDFDPVEFSKRNAARGTTKQHEMSDLDRDVLARIAARLGTADFDVIHPSLMYRLFTLYWSGHRPMSFVDTHTRFVTHDVKPIIDPALLPREYLAVKFYAARSLPDSPEMRERLRGLVRAAAEKLPVVLLDTGLVLEDDHADYALGGDRIISAKPWMTPQNNLGVQTQIVAGAKGFLGTCGSIAWMAPRLGVDTSALYVDPKWLHAHLAVAMRAYFKLNAGTFAAADLRAIDNKW